jgi:hypothetical protein
MFRSTTPVLLVFFTLVLSACNLPITRRSTPEATVPPESSLYETYPVDPAFTEFYETLGGQEVLGPAISPVLSPAGLRSQYVEAGLMQYDPEAPPSDRHRMAPLGVDLGVAEPPVPDPGDPAVRYLNGHVIYPEFVPFYERLGGAQFVGRPLTEARHNPERGRIEQYFENLGLYRLDQDDPGAVRLMAYGAYSCDQRCRYPAISNSIPGLMPFLPEPFEAKAALLGLEVLGRTLTEPHLAEDGKFEVIFENLVLVIDPPTGPAAKDRYMHRVLLPQVVAQGDTLEQAGMGAQVPALVWLPVVGNGNTIVAEAQAVNLRPIVTMLGIMADPPGPPREGEAPGLMVFVPVEGELGYYVPFNFHDWISRHGGFEFSGAPITHVSAPEAGRFRQCFTNLCLDFEPTAPERRQLGPAPLGAAYAELYYQGADEFRKENLLAGVRLEVWESQPYTTAVQGQEIHVAISQAGVPLSDREPVLTVTLPDNSQEVYRMIPTDEAGQTHLKLAPVAASNGTLIAYEVCLEGIGGGQLCVEDHYLIWED